MRMEICFSFVIRTNTLRVFDSIGTIVQKKNKNKIKNKMSM